MSSGERAEDGCWRLPFSCCLVEGNPKLQSILVTSSSFTASSLVLRDLDELESVTMRVGSFEHALHTVIESGEWSCVSE